MKHAEALHEAVAEILRSRCGRCMLSNCTMENGKLSTDDLCNRCYTLPLLRRLLRMEREIEEEGK